MRSQERKTDQNRSKVHGHYETRASSNYQATARSRHAGGGNNPSPAPHHGPEYQPLIDLTSPMNTHRHFNNANSQGVENYYNPAAMRDFLQLQEMRVDAFLQHSEKRAEEQRTALQHLTGSLSNVISNFSNSVTQWLGHPIANHTAQLYHSLDQALGQCAGLKIEYQNMASENEALKDQLKETSHKLAKVTEERDEQLRLAEGANWTGSGKVADDAVKSTWKQLDYDIRCMAITLAKCPIRLPTNDVVEERFSMITPKWAELLGDEDYKEFIFHAYIWLVIVQQVLEDTDGSQSNGFVRNFKEIREELVARAPEADNPKRPSLSLRHVARWSAQGAALFGHLFGRDQKALKRLAKDEFDKLKSFCNLSSKKPTTDFLHDMKTIIGTALDLDEMLMNSRAVFTIRWCDGDEQEPIRFDEAQMEASAHNKDLSPQSIVEFEISPMLGKTGNADGGNYDSYMVLCKASVVCE